jgi:hypothetical protein
MTRGQTIEVLESARYLQLVKDQYKELVIECMMDFNYKAIMDALDKLDEIEWEDEE